MRCFRTFSVKHGLKKRHSALTSWRSAFFEQENTKLLGGPVRACLRN